MSWDTTFRLIDGFLEALNSGVKQPVYSYCRLQTTTGKYFVADDCSLMSLFRLDGLLKAVSNDDYNRILEVFNTHLTPLFNKPGHALHIVFNYDPAAGRDKVEQCLRPSQITARNLGLNLESILEDWVDNLGHYCAKEDVFLACWTKPSKLAKGQLKKARANMRRRISKEPVADSATQVTARSYEELENEHRQYISVMHTIFRTLEMRYEELEPHSAMWVMRNLVDPTYTGENWKPLLVGDSLPLGYPEAGEQGLTSLLYPRLSHQLFPREGVDIDRKTIQVGDYIHAPLTIELMPQYPTSFNSLFATLKNRNYPWRAAFLIEPDGLAALSMLSLLSSIFAFTSLDNLQFNAALADLKNRNLHGETIVQFSAVFDTWLPSGETKQLHLNASDLAGLVQGWGSCETSEIVGDPLLGVISSIPGLQASTCAGRTAAPLTAACGMLPIARCASPWEQGSIVLRTLDGKPYPFAQGSKEQAAWVDIGAAPMGAGKSVWLNTMNLGFLLQPGATKLPWLTIIDIGPSSKGLIHLLKAALPADKKYLAAYHRLRMTQDYAVNPFDTQLGYRFPTPSQRNFLTNLVSLLCTPLAEDSPPNGIAGLAQACIDKAYEKYAETEAKLYDPERDMEVQEVVDRGGLAVDGKTTWWEITDALFELGYVHEAYRAQRQAMPLLSEVAAISNDARVQAIYNFIIDGEVITSFFWRSLTEAISQYPIFKQPTRFDLGDAQIVSFDLDEVAPRGGAQADRQSAIMFMMARFIGASRFFFMPSDATDKSLAPQYQAYHAARIEAIRETPKRLCYDEAHRVLRDGSLLSKQIVEDLQTTIRESRKWRLSIGLYSQDISDYPEIIVELATSVFILGANTEQAAAKLGQWFSLNEKCQQAITRLGKPDRSGSRMVAVFRVATGQAQQVLVSTLGPQAIWAYSSTGEDMTVRDKLMERFGVSRTLQTLAKYYPGGVKEEVERRKRLVKDAELREQISVEDILISELAEKML